MSTFLDGVNRLLRTNTIIKGDDDNIVDFTDTQHSAYIELAQIAIQNELNGLVADKLVPYEKTSATISLVTSQRVYALETDFIRFFGTHPSFYDSVQNIRTYKINGGEDKLRDSDYQYKTTEGAPSWWYWDNTTSKKVAFYSVPNDSYSGRSLEYDYEKSVSVTSATAVLPFHNAQEFQTFIQMASQRFKYLNSEKDAGMLAEDSTWVGARTSLLNLMNPVNPPKYYGRRRR